MGEEEGRRKGTDGGSELQAGSNGGRPEEDRFQSTRSWRSSIEGWERWRRWWGTCSWDESRHGGRWKEIDGGGGGGSALLDLARCEQEEEEGETECARERVSGHPNIGLSRQIPGLSELLPVRLVRLGQTNL